MVFSPYANVCVTCNPVYIRQSLFPIGSNSINQADDAEKSAHIPLMRQILEGAIRTLIWLGEGTSNSEPAIRLVHVLLAAWDRCNNDIPEIAKLRSNDLAQHRLPSFLSTDYDKLLTMLGLPWFERAWLEDTVRTSRSVVCVELDANEDVHA